MVEPSPPPSHGGNFLSQSTAGLPNWAWLLVIAGGIAAAYFIPKFFPGTSSGGTTSGGGNASGLGLAVDPTTGLPYAVEGLVPSGGTVASSGVPPLPTMPPTTTTPTTTPTSALTSAYTRNQQPGVTGQNSIPIWGTPNTDWNQDIGGIPINTQIQLGNPVQGNNGQTFYPISYNGTTGYVVAGDVVGTPAKGSTGPRPTPLWPQHSLRTRHYRIA
jgi:hypothetical protein